MLAKQSSRSPEHKGNLQEVLIILSLIKTNFVQPLIRNVEYIISNCQASPPEVELTVLNCFAASVCVIQPNCSPC